MIRHIDASCANSVCRQTLRFPLEYVDDIHQANHHAAACDSGSSRLDRRIAVTSGGGDGFSPHHIERQVDDDPEKPTEADKTPAEHLGN